MIIGVSLTACTEPTPFYEPVDRFTKLDSNADRFPLPGEAPDMDKVKLYKNDIKLSYKVDGIKEFKDLEIVKDVKIEKNEIKVEFIAQRFNKNEENNSITEYIWENSMFLLYTIVDTFPQIKKVNLYANYYYLDRYGNPYKELIFEANIERQAIEKINREYFRKEMLKHMVDYYLAKESIETYSEK